MRQCIEKWSQKWAKDIRNSKKRIEKKEEKEIGNARLKKMSTQIYDVEVYNIMLVDFNAGEASTMV